MSEVGVSYYSFVNCSQKPGNFSVADVDFEFVRAIVESHDGVVVAMGAVPAGVLRKLGISHERVPHPSRRNRVFNDPLAELAVLSDLRTWTKR